MSSTIRQHLTQQGIKLLGETEVSRQRKNIRRVGIVPHKNGRWCSCQRSIIPAPKHHPQTSSAWRPRPNHLHLCPSIIKTEAGKFMMIAHSSILLAIPQQSTRHNILSGYDWRRNNKAVKREVYTFLKDHRIKDYMEVAPKKGALGQSSHNHIEWQGWLEQDYSPFYVIVLFWTLLRVRQDW